MFKEFKIIPVAQILNDLIGNLIIIIRIFVSPDILLNDEPWHYH